MVALDTAARVCVLILVMNITSFGSLTLPNYRLPLAVVSLQKFPREILDTADGSDL